MLVSGFGGLLVIVLLLAFGLLLMLFCLLYDGWAIARCVGWFCVWFCIWDCVIYTSSFVIDLDVLLVSYFALFVFGCVRVVY